MYIIHTLMSSIGTTLLYISALPLIVCMTKKKKPRWLRGFVIGDLGRVAEHFVESFA